MSDCGDQGELSTAESSSSAVVNTEDGNGSPTESPSPSSSNTASPAKQQDDKIEILFKATGDAPILKKKKWVVPATRTMGAINVFLRKYIKCKPEDSLFLYVNQAFSPSHDVEVGTLYECFGSDKKLVLHYCKTQAWG